MIADYINTNLPQRAINPVRDNALACAKRGLPVFPFHSVKDGKCDCGFEHEDKHNGTHPCGGFTHLSATTDPATIIKWFEKWPNANFGVATGCKLDGADNVLVVVETPADRSLGEQAMAQVEAMIGSGFRTCGQVLTPQGTRQIYIEVPPEQDLNFAQIRNVKIHAKGSHVMGAGSLHQSGIRYNWEGEPLLNTPVLEGRAFVRSTSTMSATATPAHSPAAANQTLPSKNAAAAPQVAQTDFQAAGQAVIARIAENRAIAAEYIDTGFKLCRIATGSKGPQYKDWQNTPFNLGQVNHEGLGLIHALSGTCAIDLDNFESAVAWFEGRDIDLHALLEADDAVQIQSGRPNRGKLVYRLPPGIAPLTTVQIKNPDGSMLIEFRCAASNGAGCQDVLPPTIHPDTGKPYKWAGAGDFKNLPELPPAVQALWRSLLATKTAMTAPTKVATVSAGYIIPEGGRNNALFKLAGDIARAGGSTESIRAALLVENQERCMPPLPDHEVETVAKSAATNSYGAKEAAARSTMTNASDEEALKLAKKAVDDEDEPFSETEAVNVSELPAVMRDIADWNARTARTIQPAFALCTALAACSSVLARDFVGASGSYTNLYCVAVGPTASGKENALDTVSKIIDEYEWSRRAGKPASDSGVLTVMGRNPASAFVIDELGEVLQSVFDPSAASHQARIGTVLMELYTKGGKTYRGTEYAMQEARAGSRPRGDVFSPCPSIFGATTASTLYKGLSYEAIHSGFLPRILVFRAPDQIPMPNFRCEQVPMPESVKVWIKTIKDRKDQHAKAMQKQGDLIGATNSQHMPVRLPFSPAAQKLYEQAVINAVGRRNAGLDDLESNMLSRLAENASRVAVTLALADAPWADEVGLEHFKLALAIVTHATDTFMADIRANLFDSKHAKIEAMAYKQIVRFFKELGRPISERRLVDRCKPYGAAAPKDREQTIRALEAQGKITKQPGRNTGTLLYLPRG